MRRVPFPTEWPHRDWFMPSSTAQVPGGYFESELVDVGGVKLHAYMAAATVLHLAAGLGWAPRAVMERQAARLRQELEQARAEVADLHARLEAVQVLKQTGFEQARKPGRPRSPRKETV